MSAGAGMPALRAEPATPVVRCRDARTGGKTGEVEEQFDRALDAAGRFTARPADKQESAVNASGQAGDDSAAVPPVQTMDATASDAAKGAVTPSLLDIVPMEQAPAPVPQAGAMPAVGSMVALLVAANLAQAQPDQGQIEASLVSDALSAASPKPALQQAGPAGVSDVIGQPFPPAAPSEVVAAVLADRSIPVPRSVQGTILSPPARAQEQPSLPVTVVSATTALPPPASMTAQITTALAGELAATRDAAPAFTAMPVRIDAPARLLTIALDPPELGSVLVRLKLTGRGLEVALAAEAPAAARLRDGLGDLAKALHAKGIAVEALNVRIAEWRDLAGMAPQAARLDPAASTATMTAQPPSQAQVFSADAGATFIGLRGEGGGQGGAPAHGGRRQDWQPVLKGDDDARRSVRPDDDGSRYV
jgi:flagellar hook-length control protein FliK